MKNPRSWLRTVILVVCILSVTACTVTLSFCGSSSNSYTLTWHPGVSGFPDVTLTLTPVIPPKALDAKPSSYVQGDLKVGGFSFSTNDPAYQCLETVAATTLPIILAPEDEVISGFAAINDFLIVYQACGQFVQTSPVNLASRGGIAAKELIFFQITGQKLVSRAANGQELTPSGSVGVPTPTPTPVTPTPPVLSVSPSSFKLPGDPNCSSLTAGSWNCTATLTNTGQRELGWSASSKIPRVTFNPPSGILSPGQTTLVTISLPQYCSSFTANPTLIFSGPVNSVPVSVSCPPLQ